MPARAVVVTGMGVVTPTARDVDEFLSGRRRPAPSGRVLALPVGAPGGAHIDPATRAALGATAQAWSRAGSPTGHRTAVLWGVGLSGLHPAARAHESVAAGRSPAPRAVLAMSPADTVAAVASAVDASGPCRGIASACASATDAIAEAARMVAAGECDVAVAGGSEAGAVPVNIDGLDRMGVLSPSGRARPFDDARDGLVLAEGAAAIVLEAAGTAAARRAVPLARIVGYASARDRAATEVAPGRDGAAIAGCLEESLRRAGLGRDDLAAVIAHATGTVVGDDAEARGLAAVLGARVPVTAGKGATGHAMAASGALAVLEAVLAVGRRQIQPVVGLGRPSAAAAGLDLVTVTRSMGDGAVAVVSAGFGGFVSVLLISR